MEQLIKLFALVDLAVIGLVGMLAVIRLIPRQVTRPVSTRKEEKESKQAQDERRQAGEIKE